jgi:hypothetical protein
MVKARSLSLLAVLTSAFTGACSSAPPAVNAPPAPPAASAATAPSASAAPPEASAAPSASAKAAALVATSAAEPEPTETPREIITGPRVVFVLNWPNSPAKDAATAKCKEKWGEDAAKVADCVSRTRERIMADAHRFKQEPENVWWWITMQRRSNQFITLHKFEFDFGEQTDKTIQLKPKGKDKGLAPLPKAPKELIVEVPSSYSIAVEDPQFGRLVYDAKVGLLD